MRAKEEILIRTDMSGCDDHDGDTWIVDLKRAVKMLHFGNCDEKELAADEIKRLAVVDLKRRRTVVELGVIPPLVAMVGSEVASRQRAAVRGLLVLADGSFTNKAAMVEAGILSALPKNVAGLDEASKQELAQLLSSISSVITNTQCSSLNSSQIITATISILESCSSPRTKEFSLNTLYKLSSIIENAEALASRGAIETVIKLSLTDKSLSERALTILGNLVVTSAGRKAMEDGPTMLIPESLIEVMTWQESPKSQELSLYVLMILAHRSSSQRQRMFEAGIVQVLLEVALLGTPLAQKRATKLLQWFKDERSSVGVCGLGLFSGPQVGRSLSVGSPPGNGADEGRRLMERIVKQSLRKNMETITRRANNGCVDSHGEVKKALGMSSSSKSLPY